MLSFWGEGDVREWFRCVVRLLKSEMPAACWVRLLTDGGTPLGWAEQGPGRGLRLIPFLVTPDLQGTETRTMLLFNCDLYNSLASIPIVPFPILLKRPNRSGLNSESYVAVQRSSLKSTTIGLEHESSRKGKSYWNLIFGSRKRSKPNNRCCPFREEGGDLNSQPRRRYNKAER